MAATDPMTVIRMYPPNFQKIKKRFGNVVTGGKVIFTYGERIYNPGSAQLTDALFAHERVHADRQIAMGIEPWWDKYIEDNQFRFDEELPAHKAEYEVIAKRHLPGAKATEHALRAIAERLAGPLYGRMVSFDQALEAIRGQG